MKAAIKLTSAREDELRRTWYSTESADKIAARFKMASISVRRFWNDEKLAGRLPTDEPRPYFANRTAAPPPKPDDAKSQRKSREQINRESCVRALSALRAAHGGEPEFLHVMPAAFLVGELPKCKFDPDDHAHYARRVLRRLKPFFRVRDLMMRALIKKRKERRADGWQR